MSSYGVVHPDVLDIIVYNSNFLNNIVLMGKCFIYTMKF